MYVRTIQRRNKDGSVVRYLQLAHNVRKPGGQPSAKVIHSFGREDRLDREALARLVRSIGRFLEPEQALAASESEELRFIGSRPMGGAWALDALWRALGIDKAIAKVAEGRKVSPEVERLIFALVANRALAPPPSAQRSSGRRRVPGCRGSTSRSAPTRRCSTGRWTSCSTPTPRSSARSSSRSRTCSTSKST